MNGKKPLNETLSGVFLAVRFPGPTSVFICRCVLQYALQHVLQCVLHRGFICRCVLQYALQHVLQCVLHCVLQYMLTTMRCSTTSPASPTASRAANQSWNSNNATDSSTAAHCNTLQHTSQDATDSSPGLASKVLSPASLTKTGFCL